MKTDETAATYIEAFDGADPILDQELLNLGNAALELLRNIRLAIDLGPNTPERRMAQMCQAFLLGKIYRVTRSTLTLVAWSRAGSDPPPSGAIRIHRGVALLPKA